MKGLLRKDLYLMIKYCRLFFILIIVFSFAGAWNNNLFFALYPITISSIIPVNLLSYDEKSNWSLYACTFPCSRKEIVSSKYILTVRRLRNATSRINTAFFVTYKQITPHRIWYNRVD